MDSGSAVVQKKTRSLYPAKRRLEPAPRTGGDKVKCELELNH